MLTEIKNRGVDDVCMVVCGELKGLPEPVTTTWQYVQRQACILRVLLPDLRNADYHERKIENGSDDHGGEVRS